MTTDELRGRFIAEIEARGRDDKYIDGLEERELLQIAVQHGFSTDEARRFLVEVCQSRGYVIEAAVVQRIRDSLRQFGCVSRRGFERIVNDVRPSVMGTTRSDADLRRLVATTLDDSAVRIRTGWFGDWFARLKREVGA